MATKRTAKSTPDTTITAESRPGMSFSYAEAEIPQTESTSAANPHQAGIDLAVKARAEGVQKAFTVSVPTGDVNKHLTWLRRGGSAAGVTIKTVQKVSEKDATQTSITFWAVDKIARPRKEKVTPEVTDAQKVEADKAAGY